MRDFRLPPHCEIWDLSGFFAGWNDSLLLTFRDKVSVPSSRIKGLPDPLRWDL